MAIYLDSALVYEARVARDLGWVHGITTNPILLAQSELPPEETLRALSACTSGEIFYQLTASDLENMLAEAWVANHLLAMQLVLKVPATPVGFQAVARLSNRIPCGVTAVFSPAQALLAVAAGARYIIPYVNRATNKLGDGLALVTGRDRPRPGGDRGARHTWREPEVGDRDDPPSIGRELRTSRRSPTGS